MKESPRRYTNPFLSDEENEKVNFWNNQELEHPNTKDDLTNNCEDEKFRKSLPDVPSEFFEKETELYTDKNVMECNLPELLVCYKESGFHVKDICVDDGIPHGERVMFDENNHEILYNSSPANVGKHDGMIGGSLHTQFQKPELLRFSSVEDYHLESDLCSGANGKIDTDLPVLEPPNGHMDIGDNCDEVIERNLDIDTEVPVQDLQNSLPDKDYKGCEDAAAKECGTKEVDSFVPNDLKSTCENDNGDDDDKPSEYAPDKSKVSAEADTISKAIDNDGPDGKEQVNSSANLVNDASTDQVISNSIPSLQQDQPLPSLKFLLESIRGAQSPVEDISKKVIVGHDEEEEPDRSVQKNNTSNESMEALNNGRPATSNGLHGENVDKISIEPHGTPNHHDVVSDNVAMVNPVHRGEGESTGPVSGLITYSGPIAFSGSVSLRSDSSTTSTRSFAFPILQNEWNSSPVRMAKADRRRLQKQRGWKHGILCCRF